ncbi:lauroyl acyltransferase [Pararhodobacter marinus]|uniref:Lauroyl acyltransferase n=1 Tax=Pararhodobacter marinus TaxID=2184063 RepID=A0A2U2C8Q9_9RHOB|nr:lauroyl acyltransferase [Pararhodobacter marinus]PWE28276.1 lauroyl acyltransferase [Pararhodobacter marinus]
MARATTESRTRLSFRHRIEDRASAAVVGAAKLLPYERRVPAMGWFARTILGPLALNRRTRANLKHVYPDMPPAEIRRICRDVADNFGRSLIEINSGREFAERVTHLTPTGPGLMALERAHAEGRPVILVSAHFGNYDAWRANLSQRGFRVGGLYMPMTNPATNRRYVATIESIASPLFPRGAEGMADMIRFLKSGGMLGLLGDHYMANGELIDFLGKPARTATSAAKMAMKYKALLVPLYATRSPDGLSFTIEIEAPIPHTDPLTMTRALNDSASARVRAHPGQWFWLHRRWKRAEPDLRGDQRGDKSPSNSPTETA